jgi:hypothetical protein
MFRPRLRNDFNSYASEGHLERCSIPAIGQQGARVQMRLETSSPRSYRHLHGAAETLSHRTVEPNNQGEFVVTQDQERKKEVLKFMDQLRAVGVTAVTISYSGGGDEGRAEPPQFQDAAGNRIDESSLPDDLDTQKLGDLLEAFAPEGYEDGEGGHGTITFDLPTGKIRVEHNWYEIVSNPADPWEI